MLGGPTFAEDLLIEFDISLGLEFDGIFGFGNLAAVLTQFHAFLIVFEKFNDFLGEGLDIFWWSKLVRNSRTH
jgi:hypothetical protein